jgi:hypothetical protein
MTPLPARAHRKRRAHDAASGDEPRDRDRRGAHRGGRADGGHACGGELEPLAYLYAAADRAWVPAGEAQEDWRACASDDGAGFRVAVLLAEAAIGRSVADGGYLSARQLSVDLRRAADWLAAGAPFDP